MAMARTPARRRRARRGSLERPVNARLYRASLLVLSLPLLILAFSITRPGALPAPLAAAELRRAGDAPARDRLLERTIPDRVPGGPGSLRAGQWFRDQLAPYGLPVSSDTWTRTFPGSGSVRLQNLWAVAAGTVVRRDRRHGAPRRHGHRPRGERRRERHRRAGRARPRLRTGRHAGRPARALRAHDRLPLHRRRLLRRARRTAVRASTRRSTSSRRSTSTRSPDTGRRGIAIAGDSPRSPAASLVETAAKRVLEQTGHAARRAGLLQQLIDLGFPFTLYEQGPFVARGIPARHAHDRRRAAARGVHRPGGDARHGQADRDRAGPRRS